MSYEEVRAVLFTHQFAGQCSRNVSGYRCGKLKTYAKRLNKSRSETDRAANDMGIYGIQHTNYTVPLGTTSLLVIFCNVLLTSVISLALFYFAVRWFAGRILKCFESRVRKRKACSVRVIYGL